MLLRGIEWKTGGAVQKLLDVMGVRTTGPFTAHGKASVVGKELPSSSREPASDGDMHRTARTILYSARQWLTGKPTAGEMWMGGGL